MSTVQHFHHLFIQSRFSLMWGTAELEVLAQFLKRDGQMIFPLTDRNGLYGLVRHIEVCRREGMRPVVGCELVCDASFDDMTALNPFSMNGAPSGFSTGQRADPQAGPAPVDQVLCLVKTHEGYQNLCQILTDKSFYPERSLVELLEQRHDGLILISQTDAVLALGADGADVYIDLAPGHMERAMSLQKRWRLPLVATVHAALPHRSDWQQHLVLRAIATNSKLSQKNHFPHAGAHDVLCTREEAVARMAAFPRALARTGEILRKCLYVPTTGHLIFPSRFHGQDASILREKAYSGAQRRLGSVTDQVRERLEFELNMIARKGFESPFLIAEDVVRRFPITCGRGSAAASLISFCLGITHVNPLVHQLFFERFLNEGRKDPPDIDIDFPWDERDKVRDYLWDKYGRHRIAMVANLNHLQMNGCVREVAKVFGFGPTEITQFTRRLHRLRKGAIAPRLTPAWQRVIRWARRLEGTPRCLSVHCGGVVITPEDMSHYAPVLDMPIGYPTLPWDKDDVEGFGFVKLDFLGNRSLAVIRDTLKHLAELRDSESDAAEPITTWPPAYDQLNPIDDPGTQALIRSGRTVGCFYIESPATRQLLQKTRHGDYETLVAISSIIRPAANQVTEDWVQRHRHMKESGAQPNWKPIHPLFEEVLKETHGLMVYQEDVTRTAMALAGFDAYEGNLLRKIISKKAPEKLAVLKQKFERGCRLTGLEDEQIQAAWNMVESFAGYSFCKPHSASYALVSFKAAYLKLNFPEYFLAAVLSNYGGFYSTYTYLSYARRLGVRIQLPDINASQTAFRARPGRIVIGFNQIKGLKENSVQQILTVREKGAFEDLNDFIDRLELPKRDLRRLILIGCFDRIEPNRTRSSLMLQALCRLSEGRLAEGQHLGVAESMLEAFRPDAGNVPVLPAFSPEQVDAIETSILGFPVTRTPLNRYECDAIQHILAEDLAEHVGREVTILGTLLSAKTVRTKDRESMSFLTFEDASDLFECVAFPECYRQHAALFEYEASYRLRGTVENQMGALAIHLTELVPLEVAVGSPGRKLELSPQ